METHELNIEPEQGYKFGSAKKISPSTELLATMELVFPVIKPILGLE